MAAAVESSLVASFLDKVVSGLGLVVTLYDILSIGDGHVYHSDGGAHYRCGGRGGSGGGILWGGFIRHAEAPRYDQLLLPVLLQGGVQVGRVPPLPGRDAGGQSARHGRVSGWEWRGGSVGVRA